VCRGRGYESWFLDFSQRFCAPDYSGLSNLTMLSLRSNNLITAAGMSSFAHLVSLKNLDLEWCPHIHSGFVDLKGETHTTLKKMTLYAMALRVFT
jgi:hypothetical protein